MASRRLFDGAQQELGLLPIAAAVAATVNLAGEATATVTAAATLTSNGIALAGEATANVTAVGAVVITSPVRATQALVETLYTDAGDPRVSQALVETLYTDSGDPRVTQTVVEVLYRWRLFGEATATVDAVAALASSSVALAGEATATVNAAATLTKKLRGEATATVTAEAALVSPGVALAGEATATVNAAGTLSVGSPAATTKAVDDNLLSRIQRELERRRRDTANRLGQAPEHPAMPPVPPVPAQPPAPAQVATTTLQEIAREIGARAVAAAQEQARAAERLRLAELQADEDDIELLLLA